MAAKNLIATGVTSGIGFEILRKLLLEEKQAYRLLLGVRDPAKTKPELDALKYDSQKHSVSLFRCDFSDLRDVKSFADDALSTLGQGKLDYLILCAGMVVNHLSGHYLTHLLRSKIEGSNTRVVVVSSGAIRIKSVDGLKEDLLADSKAEPFAVYSKSKFVQLLGALWWRRQLGARAEVVAVSPGLIPGTGLGRHTGQSLPTDHPDAKSQAQGAESILRAAHIGDLPKDPDTIFLTSWGEWWNPKEIYPLALDKNLQDDFCPSKEEIEREAKL